MFTPKIGEDEPNLTNRFFRWVENHQLPLDPKTMKNEGKPSIYGI